MCTMMNVITALALSCFCWIAVSGSEFQTSEVQAEGRLNVTVMQLMVGGTDEPQDDMDCISKQAHEVAKLTSVTLGVLSVFLLMVITGLAAQNMKLQTANKEEQNLDQSTNHGSDEVNYAAVTVRPKPKRREIEPNVIYASTR
ncbi:uncharacterized protein LOC120436328 isoform X3 [Oreochromis aureus]|uniref:uncharacterized protein LOC120436328 isoform X3 n=1 Tax=Oreochromis aureus TaxID=47969 RepID=UPI0019547B50|nr:uncharacterized protein LOC120436328 isoform X3 [Oreochromis aureus]